VLAFGVAYTPSTSVLVGYCLIYASGRMAKNRNLSG
jgi:hypothetical protein